MDDLKVTLELEACAYRNFVNASRYRADQGRMFTSRHSHLEVLMGNAFYNDHSQIAMPFIATSI